MRKKLLLLSLLLLLLLPIAVYGICRYNSEENKAERAKSAVAELLEGKSYTGKQIYELAIEASHKGDPYKAFYFLCAAADTGFDSAEYGLGRCYYHGSGTEKNNDKAIKWMTRAAEQGNPQYQYELGSFYEDLRFEEVEENSPSMAQMAAAYYLRAARQGHPYAQERLGQCYRLGMGVEKDLQEAEKWLLLAKQQGVKLNRQLAWLYLETNRSELAIPLLQEDALQGSIQAKRMLDKILKEISEKKEEAAPPGVPDSKQENDKAAEALRSGGAAR